MFLGSCPREVTISLLCRSDVVYHLADKRYLWPLCTPRYVVSSQVESRYSVLIYVSLNICFRQQLYFCRTSSPFYILFLSITLTPPTELLFCHH